jgi:hypothetical protein
MIERLSGPEGRLLELLAQSPRGPKRNGVFAVWIFVRVCDGLLLTPPLSLRAHRRRLEALERRLASLSVPAPLKRALASAVRELFDGGRLQAAMALQRLAVPARETLGPEVGDALGLAARIAREPGVGQPAGRQ